MSLKGIMGHLSLPFPFSLLLVSHLWSRCVHCVFLPCVPQHPHPQSNVWSRVETSKTGHQANLSWLSWTFRYSNGLSTGSEMKQQDMGRWCFRACSACLGSCLSAAHLLHSCEWMWYESHCLVQSRNREGTSLLPLWPFLAAGFISICSGKASCKFYTASLQELPPPHRERKDCSQEPRCWTVQTSAVPPILVAKERSLRKVPFVSPRVPTPGLF